MEPSQENTTFMLTRNQNPFLIGEIVERILIFYKSTNQDIKSFSSLRLISKLWDIECGKFLRKETQMPLSRILHPYPDGLGWTWNRRYRTTGYKYHYKCPLPPTKPFENIQITASCKVANDRQVIRWLKVIGDIVKSLHFISPLKCHHQNDFHGNILQTFCPNLETLHLDGIQCFPSLIYIFEGRPADLQKFRQTGMNCSKLKTLTISVEADLARKECRRKPDQLPIQSHHDYLNSLYSFQNDLKSCIEAMSQSDLAQFGNLFYQTIGPGDSTEFAEMAEEYFDEMDGVDFGILANIFYTAPLQKLVIRKLTNLQQFEQLAMSLLYQGSNVLNTLSHLEFNDAVLDGFCLKVISILRFPLTNLRLDKMNLDMIDLTYLHDVLENFADTLTNLEISSDDKTLQIAEDFEPVLLEIPILPQLTSFTNNSIVWLPVNGNNLFYNCPSLRKCFIRNQNVMDGSSALNTYVCTRAMSIFCECVGGSMVHPQRLLEEWELKSGFSGNLVGICVTTAVGQFIMEIEVDNSIKGVLDGMCQEWPVLESVCLTIAEGMETVFIESRKLNENFIEMFFESLTGITTFELKFSPERKGFVTADLFTEGFAKLPYLTNLKLYNLLVGTDDVDDTQRKIAHIPFLSFSNVTYISMREFERKVGSVESKP